MILFQNDEIVCLRVNLELARSVRCLEYLMRLDQLLFNSSQLFTKVRKLENPK